MILLSLKGSMHCTLINSKYFDTPVDPNVKLLPNQVKPLSDPEKYRRLVGKLNYLIVTRPNISFTGIQ